MLYEAARDSMAGVDVGEFSSSCPGSRGLAVPRGEGVRLFAMTERNSALALESSGYLVKGLGMLMESQAVSARVFARCCRTDAGWLVSLAEGT